MSYLLRHMTMERIDVARLKTFVKVSYRSNFYATYTEKRVKVESAYLGILCVSPSSSPQKTVRIILQERGVLP